MGVAVNDPDKAVDYMLLNGGKFAAAKAERVYLENFLRSKKALLMAESPAEAANAREQYAYSHPDYLTLLAGLKAAVEVEEELRWHLVAAQARVDIWRTRQATARAQDRATC